MYTVVEPLKTLDQLQARVAAVLSLGQPGGSAVAAVKATQWVLGNRHLMVDNERSFMSMLGVCTGLSSAAKLYAKEALATKHLIRCEYNVVEPYSDPSEFDVQVSVGDMLDRAFCAKQEDMAAYLVPALDWINGRPDAELPSSTKRELVRALHDDNVVHLLYHHLGVARW